MDVTVDVGGRDVGAVSDDIRAGLDRMDFPLEYHAELLGDYGDEQRAQGRLLTFAIAAAIGIFLLLQAAFGSWRAVIISFVMLPASLAGGAIAAWIDEGPMTLATVAGLLAVLAIALRNDITLIEGFRRLRTAEGVPFGPDLVARGARVREVVTTVGTALVTALLVAPALVPGVVPGLEVLHPMIIVILGGLVTSTAVNLLVLPAVPAVRSTPGA